jgi:hypothetical protein
MERKNKILLKQKNAYKSYVIPEIFYRESQFVIIDSHIEHELMIAIVLSEDI